MKPKRERFYVAFYSALILMFIIGPFILEHSNRNAVPLLMVIVTALGGLLGFSLFRFKLPTTYSFAGFGLFLAVFWALAIVQDSFSPTYLNWGGGFIAGVIVGAWPAQREAEARQKAEKEPAPGWHLNSQEIANSSVVAEQSLAALQGLDGSARYFLSVTFGPSRLDIVGNYNQGVVVFCTPDTRAMKNWSVLLGPGSDKETFKLRTARDCTTLPTNNLVMAERAQEALTYFIAHQTPDPGLKWFTGNKVFARRPLSTR